MMRIGVVLLMALLPAAVAAAEADPFNGVWSYDVAQSTGSPGKQTLTITVRGEEETYISEWSNDTGRRFLLAFVVRYDGVPVPTTRFIVTPEGTVSALKMEVAARRTGATSRVLEHRVDGRVVRRLERSVGADGRSIISALTDYDSSGKPIAASNLVFVARKAAD